MSGIKLDGGGSIDEKDKERITRKIETVPPSSANLDPAAAVLTPSKETKKSQELNEAPIIRKNEKCIEFIFQSKQQRKEYLAALRQAFKNQGIKEGEDEDRYQVLSDNDSDLTVRVQAEPSILSKIEPFLSDKPLAETEDERTIKLTFQSREQKKGYILVLKQRLKSNNLKAGEDEDRYRLLSDDDSVLIIRIEASPGILDTIKPFLLVPVHDDSKKKPSSISSLHSQLQSFVQPSFSLQKETEISPYALFQEIQKIYSLLQKGDTSIIGIGRDAYVAKGGFLKVTATRNLVELNYQKSDPQDIACTLILKICTQLDNHNEDFYRLHGLNFYYQSSTVEEIPQDDLHEWIKNLNIQEHKGILKAKGEENVRETARLFLGVQKEVETEEDRGDVLLLLGEPGSGKSLFIWELIQETLSEFCILLENATQDEKERHGWEAWLKIYKKWLEGKGIINAWLPVYIELKDYTLQDLKDVLNKYLQKEVGLSGRDLPSFIHSVGKTTPRILLILDGFDELRRAPNDKEIKDLFQHCLGDWSKERRPVKLLITCRTRYFKTRAEEMSVFKRSDGSDTHQHYMRRLLLPLREKQIYEYIEGYINEKKQGASIRSKSSLLEVEAYKSALRANVQLKDVVRNPLVLWMFIEALPSLQKGVRESYIPSFHIYETFVAQWFERELSQVRKEYLNLSDISDEDKILAHHFNQFAEHLAISMFNQNTLDVRFDKSEEARECDLYMLSPESKLTPEMEDGIKATKRIAVQRRDKGDYCLFFLSKEKQQIECQTIDTKKYTPLIEALDKESFSGKQCSKRKLNIKNLVYEVVTVSGGYIQDRIYDIWDSMFRRMISESEEEKSKEVEQRLMQFKSISPMRSIGGQHSFMHRSFYEYYIVARLLTLAEENELFEGVKTQMLEALNHRKIQEESQVLLFLAEFSKSFQEEDQKRLGYLKTLLLEIVENSKEKATGSSIAQASGNAMTLLNAVRSCFFGSDLPDSINLTNACIRGADLTGSYWYRVSLRNTDMSNCDLRFSVWIECDLTDACLQDVQWGELPSICCKDAVHAIALDPEKSSRIAVAAGENIILYDRAQGVVISTLRGHTKQITCLQYAPNGTQLASGGGDDNTVLLWDPDSAEDQKPKAFKGHEKKINCMQYAPDGTQLASGGLDNTVQLWDPWEDADQKPKVLSEHKDDVLCIQYAPDGKQLASGSVDKTVRLWNPWGNANQKPKVLEGHQGAVLCLQYTPDGLQLASAGLDGTVRLWDPHKNMEQEPKILIGHSNSVLCIQYAPDGMQLASGGLDNTVQLWDSDSFVEQKPRILMGHRSYVSCVQYVPNEGQLISGGGLGDNTVRFWNLRGGAAQKRISFEAYQGEVLCVRHTSDGVQLASGGVDKIVRSWHLSKRANQKGLILKGHQDEIVRVQYAPDGVQLASVGGRADKTIRIWDLGGEAAQKPKIFQEHKHITSIRYAPDSKQLVSGNADGEVRLWDISKDENRKAAILVGQLDITILCIAYAPNGKQLALGGTDEKIWLLDLSHNKNENQKLKTLKGHMRRDVTCIQYAPDGLQLASGGEDCTVRLWDLIKNGDQEPEILKGHTNHVRCVQYAANRGWLASGGYDQTVRLWNLRNNKCSQVLYWIARIIDFQWSQVAEKLILCIADYNDPHISDHTH